MSVSKMLKYIIIVARVVLCRSCRTIIVARVWALARLSLSIRSHHRGRWSCLCHIGQTARVKPIICFCRRVCHNRCICYSYSCLAACVFFAPPPGHSRLRGISTLHGSSEALDHGGVEPWRVQIPHESTLPSGQPSKIYIIQKLMPTYSRTRFQE